MKYHCDICHKKIEGGTSVYIDHTEEHIMDEIKSIHPEWVEKDGLCSKCVEYYKKQMKKN